MVAKVTTPTLATPAERLEWLREAIADELPCDVGDIRTDSELKGDLGADSLDLVELCVTIEEEFGLNIPDDKDLTDLETVGQWHQYIEKLLPKSA